MTFKEFLKKVWNFSNQQLPGSPLRPKNLQKLRPGLDFNINEDKQGLAINFLAGSDFVMGQFKNIKICEKNQQLENFQVPCDVVLKFDHQNKLIGIGITGDVLPELYKLSDKQLYKKATKFPKIFFIIIVVYIYYYLFSLMFK